MGPKSNENTGATFEWKIGTLYQDQQEEEEQEAPKDDDKNEE